MIRNRFEENGFVESDVANEAKESKKKYVSPKVSVKKFSMINTITLSEGDPSDVDDGQDWGPLTPA